MRKNTVAILVVLIVAVIAYNYMYNEGFQDANTISSKTNSSDTNNKDKFKASFGATRDATATSGGATATSGGATATSGGATKTSGGATTNFDNANTSGSCPQTKCSGDGKEWFNGKCYTCPAGTRFSNDKSTCIASKVQVTKC